MPAFRFIVLIAVASAAVQARASQPMRMEALLKGSIEATVVRQLGPKTGPALAAQVARLLRWRGDVVRNIHPKDRMILLYEDAEDGDDADDGPALVALSYEGAEVRLQAHRYRRPGDVLRFYDREGQLVEPWLENPPLSSYVQITELMQHGRGKRQHDGLDFKAPVGTPVVSPWAAVVKRVNWRQWLNGKCVEVQFDSGRTGVFLHLSEIAAGVSPGRRLAKGAAIGAVGSTGRSGAPHLHYEVRAADGTPLDPLKVHGVTRLTLAADTLQAFSTVRGRQERWLRNAARGQ